MVDELLGSRPPMQSIEGGTGNSNAIATDASHNQEAFPDPTLTAAASAALSGEGGQAESDCDDSWPRWYFQAESIFMWRNNDARSRPADWFNDANARAIDFEAGIGPLLTIGVQLSANNAWEARYFGPLEMTGAATGTATSAIPSNPTPYDPNSPFLPVNNPFSFSRYSTKISYQSDLQSAEITYIYSWNQLALLGGFRFVRLTENFSDGAYFERFASQTENNLFGGQLGARWSSGYERISWDVTGKAGVFGNDAQQSQSRHVGPSAVFQPTAFDSTVAFVGDVNLSANFGLSTVWSIRGGYNLMWIDRVALAPDQRFQLQNGAVATDGSLFLHGLDVGLTANW